MCWPRPSLQLQRHGLFVYCSGRSISILCGHIFSGLFTLDFFMRMPSYQRQRIPFQGKFMNQFKDSREDSSSLQLKCKTVTICIAEESLAQRRTIRRGIGTIKQCDGLHFVTKRTPCPGRIPRKHTKGSTAGDMIPEVPFPAIDECWRLKVA